MYEMIKHAHSGLRWVVLVLLLMAIFNAYSKWKAGKDYTDSDRKTALFSMIFLHIQLVLGLALYFMGPWGEFSAEVMKNSTLRFYNVEHLVAMIIAIAVVTMGYSKAKRTADAVGKFRKTFWYYLIGLILILLSIPWPFRFPNAGWF